MRALVWVHRWLGVAFCLFFAMWFLTGIVMHFVPFPALTETERVAGLGAIDSAALRQSSTVTAVRNLNDAARVRLFQRSDGPIYIAYGENGMLAVHADLSPAGVQSEKLAMTIGVDYARRRGIATTVAAFSGLEDYDQWTVSNGLDPHRPLFRIALNDAAATELYVSSTTGEVMRDTTRFERNWNYVGSVLHWIYPTALRRSWSAWDNTVWTLSLAALIAAVTGALLGVSRLQYKRGHLATPFRGWQAWHHWLGLCCMIFVLTWIFSGWLSMDHGRLFSSGQITASDEAAVADTTAWKSFSISELSAPSRDVREVEWFAADGRIYRRERYDVDVQNLALTAGIAQPGRMFLQAAEVSAIGNKLATQCQPAVSITPTDDYPVASTVPGAPVYRLICGETWFHVDGANGAILEKLDASRRAYRWFYQALHTLDFPALVMRPRLRTTIITVLCGLGVLFSITAVVIAWRRLRRPTL
jgi:uncharacterized iron-regulated membrane protein